jgi:hypothetical protein
VALWLVIDLCVNFGRVYCNFLVYIFLFLNFLRHQTMDKVQKYNSFKGCFVSAAASILVLGPTHHPIQWAPGIRRPESEADYSPPSSAEG